MDMRLALSSLLAAAFALAGCSAGGEDAPLSNPPTSSATAASVTTTSRVPTEKLSEVWNDRLAYLDTSPCIGTASGGTSYTGECDAVFVSVAKLADRIKADAERTGVPAVVREAVRVGDAARSWTERGCAEVRDDMAKLNCLRNSFVAVAGPASMLEAMRDAGH